MLFANNVSICLRRNIKQVIRMSTNVISETLQFKSTFSDKEEHKILSILNESNAEQLSRFDVTKSRIKKLESWRLKNGPFRSLSEILEVESLGEKVLERLCTSIVHDKSEIQTDITAENCSVPKSTKNRRLILSPQLRQDSVSGLETAVGIHLAPTGVSWAELCRDGNEVNSWSYHDFSQLPKKLLPTDTFDLAQQIISEIPVGDVYVMESQNGQSKGGKQPVPTYSQHLELSSMLLALLNTSERHNADISSNQGRKQAYCNMVYYLRSNLPARLFRTLVGNERVAVSGIVTKLLDSSDSLPCTPIVVRQALREQFGKQSAVHRDMMGQALLLVVTFLDLCVYKNQASIAAIAPSRKSQVK